MKICADTSVFGGDTMWPGCYAAYERPPDSVKHDLENLEAAHDLGDFRNSFTSPANGRSGGARLDENVPRFGHMARPPVAARPVTGRKFLNFNEALVTRIAGPAANESNALRTFLANPMNRPEDRVRRRWRAGDLAVRDNRVTLRYALADCPPHYHCMHRITVAEDSRAP